MIDPLLPTVPVFLEWRPLCDKCAGHTVQLYGPFHDDYKSDFALRLWT
jgi:hypothetical protein